MTAHDSSLTSHGFSRATVWATPELLADLATKAFTVRVRDALALDGCTAIREHDGLRLV
ncbi:hypothetical protein ABZ297_31075 [Nonomuraea sp. NPDC005983]|uniref:hypothetical protein n=1 Tax=Nonomuraea sp. NPDC005983 TaxID=3155595 RepID=UPI0033A49766